jgi:sRNA-binding protein
MLIEEKPSTLASAGPFECASTPPAHSLNSQNQTTDQTLSTLAELFPAVFVADRWKPHRPLKVGIHQDLIERGLLSPDECRAVFRRYCSRLMYQRALAAGGPRYGLDGEPAGEVTGDQMAGVKAAVTSIEAKGAAKAKAIAAERTAARKVAKTTKTPVLTKAPREGQPAASVPSAKPARLGLAELKEAARARRERVGKPQDDARNSGSAPVLPEKVGG